MVQMTLFLRNLFKPNSSSSPLFDCKTFIKSLSSSSDTISMSENENKVIRKPRYDGRTKKRQWEDRRSDKGAGLDSSLPKLLKIDESSTKTDGPVDKIKRRKFALLMGYSGVQYYGMQRNPNTRTIEEDLFKALLDADFINQECYDQVQNMQFQRAARTDKGVSAVRQVVSLKMKENFDLAKVNERLCEDVKVFAFKRVTKGFNSKAQCDGRTYMYVIPTVAFADQKETPTQKGFRISEDILKKVNEVLHLYVGTKNFHNFTVKKKFNDPSSKRFIRSFVCEQPFVRDDVEFCAMKVYGQSFMMHQIRKMVGLVLAVIRGITTQETVVKALTEEKVNVPRAPGLGLLLDQVHYERYNFRYGKDGMHETLTWEEVDKEVEEFRDKHILPTIINTEIKEELMVWWVQNKLARHAYDDVEAKEESDDEGGGDDDAEDQECPKKEDSENVDAVKITAGDSV